MSATRVRSIPIGDASSIDAEYAHRAVVPDWSADGFVPQPDGGFGFKLPAGSRNARLILRATGPGGQVDAAAETISVAFVVEYSLNEGGRAVETRRQMLAADLTLAEGAWECELPRHATRLCPRITTGLSAAPAGADKLHFYVDAG